MRASEDFSEVHEAAPHVPLRCSLTITDAGLTLGRGTVLARLSHESPPLLPIEAEEERTLAVLSAALGKSVPARTIENLRRGARWEDDCALPPLAR